VLSGITLLVCGAWIAAEINIGGGLLSCGIGVLAFWAATRPRSW
jgi:hypothetical protein